MNTVTHHGDPGLQPERTDMAWARTAMAYALCSAVLVRWAWVLGPFVFVLVTLLFGVAATVALTQRRRYQRMVEGIRTDQIGANFSGVLLMSGALVIFGGLAIILILAV